MINEILTFPGVFSHSVIRNTSYVVVKGNRAHFVLPGEVARHKRINSLTSVCLFVRQIVCSSYFNVFAA